MTTEDREIKTLCEDISNRQWHRRAPKHIADVVGSLMARRGYAHVKTVSDCAEAWEKAVGPKLAEHSRAGNVRRNVLEVVVRNSVVMQELTFQKKPLVKQLANLVPQQEIRDLRFRIGCID
jgi:predicted nucleic acid-binding Zn ribbon protein